MRRVNPPLAGSHSGSLPIWRVAEWRLKAGVDDSIVGVFTGPDGAVLRRDAFPFGSGELAIRFAPTAVGEWIVQLECPSVPELDGAIDHFETVAATGDGALSHGFLKVTPGASYLEHADGTPFLWLGDTHWRFTSESWDESNKPGWTSQFRGTVDRRTAQGYSVYQANLMLFDWGAEHSRYFIGDSDDLDLEFLHEVVDPRVAYVADSGLVIALGLGWHQAVDGRLERIEKFARHIVARYGAYPIVWTLGGEVPGYEPELKQSRLDRWRRIAEIVRAADGYRHPMTAHSTNERPLPAYYADEPWFDFALNQHGHGDLDLSPIHYSDFFNAHPGIPMVEGETLYEALTSVEAVGRRTVDDTMVRQAAYRAMQSGCCGFSYGAQGGWNGAWEKGSFDDVWGNRAWYEGIDLPGGEQLRHLRGFYERLPWHELQPTADCFEPGDPLNAAFYQPLATADATRAIVVVYFDERYRTTGMGGSLRGLAAPSYTLSWFDPRSGQRSIIDPGRDTQSGTLAVPDPPEMRDWLLVARDARSTND